MNTKSNTNLGIIKLTRLVLFFVLIPMLQMGLLSNFACAEKLDRYHFTSVQMGGPWGITIYAPTEVQAKSASDLAFKRISEINQVFSDYSDTSELNKIISSYKVDQPLQVSDEFFTLTQTAQDFSQDSMGAFDISVGPLTQLWRRAYRKKQFPADEIWQTAHKKVGYDCYKLNPCDKTITFKLAGMKFDYGAIAKGYAADQALQILKQEGYKSALVDGNGSFAAGDPPPEKEFWTIEILQLEKPRQEIQLLPHQEKILVKLKNQGISTSGDYSQSITIADKRYSHIIDPITGKPQHDQRLVTVIANDAMTADALSTILCIKGESFVKTIQEKHQNLHVYGAVLIDNSLTTFSTETWGNLLIE